MKHRRRLEIEAKAKFVASVWGADFVQFLAALVVLPRSIWKNRMNSSFSSKSTLMEESGILHLKTQGFLRLKFRDYADIEILILGSNIFAEAK